MEFSLDILCEYGDSFYPYHSTNTKNMDFL